MKLRWYLTLFLLISYWPTAHASINYYSDRKVWVLQAGHATYAMGVNERGELQPIYWGAQIKSDADCQQWINQYSFEKLKLLLEQYS